MIKYPAKCYQSDYLSLIYYNFFKNTECCHLYKSAHLPVMYPPRSVYVPAGWLPFCWFHISLIIIKSKIAIMAQKPTQEFQKVVSQ